MNRYETSRTIKDINGIQRKSTIIFPAIPNSPEDIYIKTTTIERLDKLAFRLYEDSSLWWAIAATNNLGKGTLIVKPGVRLRIPPLSAIQNNIEFVNNNR